MNRRLTSISTIAFFLLFILISCAKEGDAVHVYEKSEANTSIGSLFSLTSAESSGITFRNEITENSDMHGLTWDAVYFGGGVGVGDINNDGLDDIFLGGNQVTDALYLNKGNLTFENISTSSSISTSPGWSTGISMVDINADGFLDIYVCRISWKMDDEDPQFRKNKLFINNGDLTFTERASEYGLDYEGYSTQATFLDFDKDGDLDMFLLNAPSNNLAQKANYAQKNIIPEFTSDKFFINEGGKFRDATKQVGVHALSYGLGVVAADIDHDNWPDLYVANDYERPDYLYINQKDGTFKNLLDKKMKHISFTSMGCDAADINNDGLVDIAVLDMQSSDHVRSKTNMPSMDTEQFWGYVSQGYNYQYMSNTLQVNNGSGYFSDIAQYTGMSSTDWSWSVLMADFDNNSFKDVFITNGINRDLRNNDFKMRFEEINRKGERVDLFKLSKDIPSNPLSNRVYKNDGNYQFSEMGDDWGLDQHTFSFGAAYSDFDNDGDLDIVVNNNNERAYLYQNNSNKNQHYLAIKINGSEQNPLGYGAKVFIYQDNDIQYQELNPVRGYQSSVSSVLHFGLGSNNKINRLICIFPDEKTIQLNNVEGDKLLTLSYSEAQKQNVNVYSFQKNIFTDCTNKSGIDFTHKENQYDDFKEEILLPHAESTKGPYQAIGDVNGDGLEDLFIGGASGQAGSLFIQQSSGSFKVKPGPWSAHEAREDMGCAFLDADGDGDADLYVASGGNASDEDEMYQDRLYSNDGRGNFTSTSGVLPTLASNSSCVATQDYDGDGDVDIFIGGLVEYGRYPYPGQSVLLQNNGGKFIDVSKKIATSLDNIGMVTGASWADVNADDKPDLIIVGEWMRPTAFINSTNGFKEDASWISNIDKLTGWWMSIQATELNRDGKPDFVVGNFGTNNKYHPSAEKPLKIYSSDFDENQTNDIVLAKNYKGNYVPVRGRECSSEQMPFVAEKFGTYASFANASIESVLEGKIDKALKLEVCEFQSGVLISAATGYEFQPFPAEAQFFPVMASLTHDFNKDGLIDILLIGNIFDAEVETTRHDSGNGLYLQAKPDGTFSPLTILNSGFYAPFNSRSLGHIQNTESTKEIIVVGSNGGKVLTYSFTK